MKPLATAVLVGALALAPSVAWADDAPAAEELAKAAAAFDDGSRAYREGRFELAASHFEAADQAVPSARALRMAMRARQEAGQGARAATLAGQALLRYGKDEKTRELAESIVSSEGPKLHRLEIRCTQPCVVALGDRAVPGQPRRNWRVYVEPGEVTVGASFSGGGADEQVVEARAGGDNSLSFVSAAPAPRPATPSPEPERTTEPASSPPPDAPDEPVDVDGPSWIQHPGVFVTLLIATAGVGGVTIWSGVDTIKNPGTERVQDECAGQGSDCELYQLGRRKQLRTNILIGATAGVAALTAVFGIFITEWGGGDAPVEAALSASPEGGGLSLRGRF